MAILELFSLNPKVEKLQSSEVTLEKSLQKLIEENMENFLTCVFFNLNL